MAVSIAERNQRITIQRNETVTDRIGNHTSAWTDFLELWANVTMTASTEGTEAGVTSMTQGLKAIVLKSAETTAIRSNCHRIIFDGEIYNITGVVPYYTSRDLVQITAVSQKGRPDGHGECGISGECDCTGA